MIRRREVSSTELTRLVLDRIDAVNPMLNAVVELRREAALLEAAAADQAIMRGEEVGPLHGVPKPTAEADGITYRFVVGPEGCRSAARVTGRLHSELRLRLTVRKTC
jgi:hypothetical protein